MSVAGFFVGVIGLAGLEVLVSSSRATAAAGGAAQGASSIVERIISPSLGLIPNLHDSAGPSASSSLASASSSTPITPAVPDPPTMRPHPIPTRPQAKSAPAGPGTPPIVAKGTG